MAIPLSHTKDSLISQLDKALQYHNTGKFELAKELYHTILNQDPNHPDALHLLGVLIHQSGKHDRAVQLIQKGNSPKSIKPILLLQSGCCLSGPRIAGSICCLLS